MNENQRTVTLPTFPKEVADLIENLRNPDPFPLSDEAILTIASHPGSVGSYREILRSIPFDTLLAALVNGYVVEKSAEELAHDKIRVEYQFRMSYAHRNAIDAARADAIVFTLQTLGIKIEGVNA